MPEKPRHRPASNHPFRRGKRASPARAAPTPVVPVDVESAEEPEEEPAPEALDGVEESDSFDLDPKADALAGIHGADEGDHHNGGDHPESTAIVPARSRALAPAKADTLAAADLLQRYMADVSRYPLLTRDEETEIARDYQRTQDPKLAYRLVTANLRLVVKIAWEYRRAAFNLLDLIQEGNVGLMQGVKKFDPERGVKLSSYAAWWIRAYIIRYLMDNWRMVKLGTTQAQRKIFFNLRKEKEKLAAQGFEPEPRLLAERLHVTEQDVIDMDRRLGNDEFSIDAPFSDDSSATYADRLMQGGQAVDERLADQEISSAFKEHLLEFAKNLQEKERFIYEKRLIADDPMTLQEVGDHYGISRERARQIEARLTGKLRAYMKEHLPDFDELSLSARDE